MSVIIKSGSSGNLANVDNTGRVSVSVDNNPTTLTLDKTITGLITTTDVVVPAPGGIGQMVSGNSTAGSYLPLNTSGVSSWSMSVITGTFTTTFYFEGSIDSTDGLNGNWIALFGRLIGNSGNENHQSITINNEMFEGTCGGLAFVRLRAVGGAITVPPTVTLRAGTVATISIGTPLPTGSNTIGAANIVDAAGVNLAAVDVAGDVQVDVNNFPVTPVPVAKGIQGATATPVQDLKDSGRVLKVFSATFTAATTEALITLTPITDGTAGIAATTFTVTAGKRLRLQTILVTVKNAAAAAQGVVTNLRISSSGTVTAASPLAATTGAGTATATANLVASNGEGAIPDGLELSGTMQFGISQIGTATAGNTVTLIGYEY